MFSLFSEGELDILGWKMFAGECSMRLVCGGDFQQIQSNPWRAIWEKRRGSILCVQSLWFLIFKEQSASCLSFRRDFVFTFTFFFSLKPMKVLRIQQAEKQNTYFNPMVIYRLNLVPQRETNIFTSLETLKYLPQTRSHSKKKKVHISINL